MLSGTYTGVVFQDYNANGVRDVVGTLPNASGVGAVVTAVDRGLAGVSVVAYGPNGAVAGTAITAADGTYALTANGTGPYRIQFGNLPAGFSAGPQGPDSKTAVRFVPDGGGANVSLGAVRPGDVSVDNPFLATQVYSFGAHDGAFADNPSIVGFPYSAGTAYTDPSPSNDPATYMNPGFSTLATHGQVGTTWGLAYNPKTGMMYAAAFFKKHADFGPGGAGAIYQIPVTYNAGTGLFTATGAPTVLTTLATASANAHNPADFDTDNWDAGWDAVGTSSLGGVDVSADGSTLYVMNLADKSLYSIPLANPGAATAYPVPIPADATGPGGSDIRPFAVTVHDGQVYVGMVNSAESTQNVADLHAYVYRFDPATQAYTPVLEVADMTYNRGVVLLNTGDSAKWNPWSATYQNEAVLTPTIGIYTQPMLTGLAFDAAGNLILGLRDRGGDQFGWGTQDNPALPAQEYQGVGGGDTLRATPNGNGTFTIEQGIYSAPPGTENSFYTNQDYVGIHSAVTEGGLAQVPGFQDVAVTAMDPGNTAPASSGGVRWFNNVTGQADKAYTVFSASALNTTFGKSNGMGDLIYMSMQAPIEIGHRLWLDTNRDGIQDPDEPPLAGVTVELRDADGNVIATAVTDADGNYTFSNDPRRTSTGSAVYGLLLPDTNYSVVVPPDQPALGTLIRTRPDGGNDDAVDSDGQPNGSNGWTLPVTTGGPGVSDNTLDFGFAKPLSIGNRVWEDRNNNGHLDPGEPGIPNLPVRLYRDDNADGVPDGPAVASTTTDADGYYLFTDLLPGNYIVETDIPTGYRSSTGTNGSATGPYEGAATPGPNTNIDGDDNGTTVGTVVRSGTVILGDGEPTGEDAGGRPDPAEDADGNLTVDFGFFQPLSLGNQVWEDGNNNGVIDPGEPGLPGVLVQLLDADGNVVATTTTAAAGKYLFDDLTPGDYRVRLTPPPGYQSSTGTNGSSTGPYEGAPDPNNLVDGDDNGTTVGPYVESGPVHLDVGSGPSSDPNGNPTVDFGLFRPASVGDHVFIDANGDGKQDPGESGVPGVVVRLYDQNGNVVATTTTDAAGNYRFDNLVPGTYSVGFDPSTLPPGYLFTKPGQPGASDPSDSDADPLTGRTAPFTLVPGQVDVTRDAGLVPASRLDGQVFVDLDNDGVRDPNEPPIPGTTVRLTGIDDAGNPVDLTTVTGPDGTYSFGNLRPGTYTVTEVQPPGFFDGRDRTGTAGGTTGDDVTRQIVLGPGTTATAYDFGELPADTCLEGTVYYDLNHNGRRDDGIDFGLAGVTVTLTGVDDRGQPVTLVATTDDEGNYRFEGLRPGTYTLTETPPPLFHHYFNTVGSLGGASANAQISGIVVAAGQCGQGYDFGELQPHGPQGRLRDVAIHVGNAVERLRNRRALNPTRFDAHHPNVGPIIARGGVPWGYGSFPAPPKVYRQVPTLGMHPVRPALGAVPHGPLAFRSAALNRAAALRAARPVRGR